MKTKSIIGLAVMGLMLISCQSNSYQINGFALHLQEGDTVLLAHDAKPEKPFAMTTVNHGKFYFEGTTDDDAPCRIYMKRIPECAAFFFPDQGTIAVELCLPPTPSRISGTLLNNNWQQLNDSIQRMGQKLISVMQQKDSDSLAHIARYRVVDSLHRRMSDLIVNTGKRNKDNLLGRYIQNNYKEPEFN